MLRATTLILTASLVIGFATHSEAGVIFDNLVAIAYGPSTGDFILGDGRSGGPASLSNVFVAGASENLDSILIALWHPTDDPADGLFNLTLTDASHNLLESWTGLMAEHTVDGTSVPIVTVHSVLRPQLQSGETYVLVVNPGSSVTNVGWERAPTGPPYQVRLLGTPLASTPEPSALALAGLGAIGFVARAIRRRRG